MQSTYTYKVCVPILEVWEHAPTEILKICTLLQSRAVATGTAGTAMAVPLFDKVANKFERILSLLLDLSRSMCRIRT